jgi:predicted RNA-binding Zn-ribbon protein involved in translation (DUF1610 family)
MVIKKNFKRLRCRHCHLTLMKNELPGDYCPECFETTGKKYDDFEEVHLTQEGAGSFRCEDCGEMLTPLNS